MIHVHSDYSLLDSATDFKDYVDLCLQNGQTAIATTEHGMHRGYIAKKLCCDKAGIKLLIGVEIYLTEQLEPKVRDNYHTILIAKNQAGLQELHKLVRMSTREDHFYYTNRISFDEFLSISDNIISTSACLASPLWQLQEDHPYYMRLAEKYDYLEVQPHNVEDQIAFNKRLLALSERVHKPLIVGTDTHSSSAYKAECRAILAEAKNKRYADDGFDLTYKTYDQLVEMLRVQGALPETVYLEALENTNRLADSVEDIPLDTTIKYPILYGSRDADTEKFSEVVSEKFREKIERGIIPPEQIPAFSDAIKEEMRVFKKLNMTGFMLSMSELVSWCRENNIAIGTARGSVGGSRIAYITDIIDLNPEQWHTVFSRFANESRVEIDLRSPRTEMCVKKYPSNCRNVLKPSVLQRSPEIAGIRESGESRKKRMDGAWLNPKRPLQWIIGSQSANSGGFRDYPFGSREASDWLPEVVDTLLGEDIVQSA